MTVIRSERSQTGLNATWTLAGRGLYAAAQWLTIVVIARMGGASEVGELAICLAIATPIMVFAQFSLRVVKATESPGVEPSSSYLPFRLVATAVAACLVLLVGWGAQLGTGVIHVLAWIVLAKCFDNLSDMLYGFQQSMDRHDIMGMSLAIRSVLTLVGVAVGYGLTGSLAFAMAMQAGAWVLAFAVFDLPRTLRLFPNREIDRLWTWEPKAWRGLLRLGIPLGVSAFLASIIPNIPRYFIEHELGRASLGEFAALAYVVTFANLGANSIAQGFAPRLGQLLSSAGPTALRSMIARLRNASIAMGVAAAVVGWFAGPKLIRAAYGPGFETLAPLVWTVMFAAGISFATTFVSYGLIAMRKAVPLQRALLAATFFCLTTSWLGISRFGLAGAVAAWNVGLLAQLVLSEASLRGENSLTSRATRGAESN